MIRVLVVDDHEVVRRGFVEWLSTTTDLEVVGEAGGGADLVPLVERVAPDVVLMDVSMPGVDGIEATRSLHAHDASLRIVIVTSSPDDAQVFRAVDAGAIGYLYKDASPEQLASAIRAAADGTAPFDPRATAALMAGRNQPPPAASLTRREREVVALVAEGLSNKQIGRRLGICEKTVKTHLTNTFHQIGVTSRTEAALWAHHEGLAATQERS